MTNDWIITAAHCVKDVSPSNLLVRVGEYNVLDTAETHKHTDRRITRVITHVNFDKVIYQRKKPLIRKKGPSKVLAETFIKFDVRSSYVHKATFSVNVDKFLGAFLNYHRNPVEPVDTTHNS